MPFVKANDGHQPIYLTTVDQFSFAADAAQALWQSVFEVSKVHGGSVHLIKPGDFDPFEHDFDMENGYIVRWASGPEQWANAYVVDPEATAPGFTCGASGDGLAVQFVDLD